MPQPDHGSASPPPVRGAAAKLGHSHWLFPIVAGLCLAALAGGLWWWLRPVATIQYITQPLTRGPVVRTVTASGTVNPVIVVQVGTYVSGVVLERLCDFNTEVKKGQLCARIDARPYESAVAQNRASLNIAKAQLGKDTASLTYLKAAYDRNQALVSRQAVSLDALENSRSAWEQAQAQVALDQATIELHEAELKTAELNLDYTNIRSPVDGTVVSRNVEMGQTVAASFQTPILFLIATDLTQMQVDTNVSESDVGSLKVGDKAAFTVESWGARRFQGTIAQVRQAPQTIQNVVTYDAVVAVPNKDLLLKPGMTATVRFESARRDNVLRAPDQALRYGPSGQPPVAGDDEAAHARVYVLRDGAPVAVDVNAGLDDDTYTEVSSELLHEGDALIVAEQSSLTPAATSAARPNAPRAPRL